jgi:hypothetical protein
MTYSTDQQPKQQRETGQPPGRLQPLEFCDRHLGDLGQLQRPGPVALGDRGGQLQPEPRSRPAWDGRHGRPVG